MGLHLSIKKKDLRRHKIAGTNTYIIEYEDIYLTHPYSQDMNLKMPIRERMKHGDQRLIPMIATVDESALETTTAGSGNTYGKIYSPPKYKAHIKLEITIDDPRLDLEQDGSLREIKANLTY